MSGEKKHICLMLNMKKNLNYNIEINVNLMYDCRSMSQDLKTLIAVLKDLDTWKANTN